jgi:AraC-like DNA-binding protein
MSWQTITYPMPLEAHPRIVHMGVGRHGLRPIERYQLDTLWSLHLYPYEAEVQIDGMLFPIRPGFAGITCPNGRVEYHYDRPVRHLYAHFTLPASTPMYAVPAMQDVGAQWTRLNQDFEQAIGFFATQPRRAEARLWDILWELAHPPMALEPSRRHPALDRACSIIELHLCEPFSIPELARSVGLSHNHLLRLFRATFGTTVVGFIQGRRVERSKHLLLYSDLPIKVIAAEVGIADLHLFNKTIRRTLGASPRQIREQHGTTL